MSNTHKALVNQEDKSLKVEEVPLPTVGEGEVLVKVSDRGPGDSRQR